MGVSAIVATVAGYIILRACSSAKERKTEKKKRRKTALNTKLGGSMWNTKCGKVFISDLRYAFLFCSPGEYSAHNIAADPLHFL